MPMVHNVYPMVGRGKRDGHKATCFESSPHCLILLNIQHKRTSLNLKYGMSDMTSRATLSTDVILFSVMSKIYNVFNPETIARDSDIRFVPWRLIYEIEDDENALLLMMCRGLCSRIKIFKRVKGLKQNDCNCVISLQDRSNEMTFQRNLHLSIFCKDRFMNNIFIWLHILLKSGWGMYEPTRATCLK